MPVGVTNTMTHILLGVLDLGGTFVFAISGAMAGVKHRLDVFGVLVYCRSPQAMRAALPAIY